MKLITFQTQKENHFYAERIDGELLQVKEPIKGKKYYEISVISGGSNYKPILLELQLPLCQKHIDYAVNRKKEVLDRYRIVSKEEMEKLLK